MQALVVGSAALAAAVEHLLMPHGFTVTAVAEPAQAKAHVRGAHCALVILDWSSPAGAASCRALADLPECVETSLIAITDERAPERLTAIFAAGACDALQLPGDESRLVARALAASRRLRVGVDPRLYRPVFEQNPLAMCVLDEESLRFLAVSDGAVRQYGWSREEFLRLTLRDIRPPEGIPALEEAAAKTGPSFMLTTAHRRKDGSTFLSQGLVQRLMVAGQQVRFAVSRDVTDEARLLQAQSNRLADYQQLVERSADAVFTHRPNFELAYVNPAFISFLGYSSVNDLVGRSVLDLVHPDNREFVRERIREILASGQPSAPRAVCFIGRDGKERWAETRGISVSQDDTPAITVIARDLTARRKAEEAVRLSEERFSRIFHINPAAISITRLADGRFVDVNERFVEATGYTREDVVGRTGLELELWFDRESYDSLYRQTRSEGGVRDVELRFRRKSGERVDVLISTERVEFGGELCMLALAVDISERKRFEEQRRHSHKMEAIGRLAGGIAHDFNNVLTGIRGYSELLVEALPEGSSVRDAAGHIQRSALRAASLTGQLLLFTRRQARQPEVLVLDDVVRQMGILLRPIIGGQVALELELDAPGKRVRVDPTQLEQVILNLAVNARDAMPSGGQLVIASRETTDAQGRWVCLTVSDTGTGMTDDVRSHMFEPFFTTKEIGQGTGLGLSIVYGIVEQSGGTISVDTALGRGTTLRISLPLTDAPATAEPPAPRPAPAPLGHEVVLMVEDDDDVREFVGFVLRRAGYDVLVASDGDSAIQLAEQRADIQLLVSDVVMPGMNGHQLAEVLRRGRPSLRVMHISGFPGQGENSANAEKRYLQKPFSAEELLRRVRAALEDEPG